MQAVILAAGTGSRIREFHALPKGFITLGDQTLIQQSIEKLQACGVQNILIVTGYAAEFYEALAKENKKINTIYNAHYQNYGSLFSLYCAKDHVKEDFLIVESDLIYEQRAIEYIVHHVQNNIILLSGATFSTDEVYVQAHDLKLIRMSKNKNHLESDEIAGEFVGISKLSLRDFKQLTHQLEQDPTLLHRGHYDEHGLVAMTAFTDVFCLKIPDLLWSEIDNRFQYERAKIIYEKMKAMEVV
ncbi:MAG: hypothetical protein A3E81_02015 [Gammaproteobacteria bacterium RIFCSPHIGHO2_12_FULL_36_30]|nr:MAG: hypothetical protein A3E81_02015 [Gammaproteobacteria bacterium RIFCSPHIGHO2_12_FULL_36_30]